MGFEAISPKYQIAQNAIPFRGDVAQQSPDFQGAIQQSPDFQGEAIQAPILQEEKKGHGLRNFLLGTVATIGIVAGVKTHKFNKSFKEAVEKGAVSQEASAPSGVFWKYCNPAKWFGEASSAKKLTDAGFEDLAGGKIFKNSDGDTFTKIGKKVYSTTDGAISEDAMKIINAKNTEEAGQEATQKAATKADEADEAVEDAADKAKEETLETSAEKATTEGTKKEVVNDLNTKEGIIAEINKKQAEHATLKANGAPQEQLDALIKDTQELQARNIGNTTYELREKYGDKVADAYLEKQKQIIQGTNKTDTLSVVANEMKEKSTKIELVKTELEDFKNTIAGKKVGKKVKAQQDDVIRQHEAKITQLKKEQAALNEVHNNKIIENLTTEKNKTEDVLDDLMQRQSDSAQLMKPVIDGYKKKITELQKQIDNLSKKAV